MTGSSPQAGLSDWLDQATDNLPQQPAQIIREELSDHVEDAAADLIGQGVPEETAYQRALADLGDPQLAARGFKDVYLGRNHYRIAMVISLLMMIMPFVIPQIHVALGIVDLSLADRIFYIIAHFVSILLLTYLVVTFRKLLVWRFNNQAVEIPAKIVLGSLLAYLIGNAISELTVESWYPTPTFLDASASIIERSGLLIMHGSMLAIGISFLLLLACCLSTRNMVLKAVVVIGSLFNVFYVLTLVFYYLDMPQAFLFYNLRVLTSLPLWLTISLLFLQPLYFYRRPPLQAT